MNEPNITEKKILWIADLAKISLNENEIKEFVPQIESILEWVHQIEEASSEKESNGDLSVDQDKKLTTFLDGEDVENNLDLDNPKLLQDYFIVPKVIE